MIKSSNKLLIFVSFLTPLFFTACSKHDIVAVSETHLYNQSYGMIDDPQADAMIQQEYIAMSQPTEIEIPVITDPEISTELIKDPDAFYAHEYVQPEPIITYKYPFDPKFYSHAEWRTMEFD
jgi:hypothetical protein